MLLRCYNKDAFVKLLQLALGLHALVVVQDLLADAQILRGDLQQLVLCQELQAALQAQLADGDQAQKERKRKMLTYNMDVTPESVWKRTTPASVQ